MKKKRRSCLRCSKNFWSRSPANRICNRCKSNDEVRRDKHLHKYGIERVELKPIRHYDSVLEESLITEMEDVSEK